MLQILRGRFERFAEVNLHPGNLAAWYGHFDILEWLLQDDQFAPGPGRMHDCRTMQANVVQEWAAKAARVGNIASINWLVARELPLDESACNAAAKGGHVGAL